jgi:cytochrome P450
MTLIFAGHETTAHAMTWAWYLLAKYPEVAEKLYQEVKTVCGDQPVNVEHLEHMPYVTQVMKESLRFLPSVWAFMRAPTEDITIKGYTFPKGAAIFISPYVLGRDPRNHPDADKYTPERWTREYERNLPKGAYVPFAAGPRVCAGQGFAQMEMKLLLATFVQNLVPTLADGFEPDLVPELSLHPGKRGLQCKVVFREDAPLRAR